MSGLSGYFSMFWVNLIIFVVECGLLGLVFLRIVVCGPFGRHRDLSACFGCFGSFLPCFFQPRRAERRERSERREAPKREE